MMYSQSSGYNVSTAADLIIIIEIYFKAHTYLQSSHPKATVMK